MKKHILIISIVVLIVSFFVSCSVNSSIDEVSTTAVTDSNGTTHYYEPVTDNKGNISTTAKNPGVFAEIETQPNGKTVTNKNGTYVTNEHTTVLPIENKSNNTSNTIKSESEKISSDTTKDIDNDDNIVEFEPTDTTNETKPNTTTTENNETENNKTTQSATDKDGWINKWY